MSEPSLWLLLILCTSIYEKKNIYFLQSIFYWRKSEQSQERGYYQNLLPKQEQPS